MPNVLENLYHNSVAGEKSLTASSLITVYAGFADRIITLPDVSLNAGDVISCSVSARNLTSGDNVRLELVVRDAAQVVLNTFVSGYVNTQAFLRFTIPNITLPAATNDAFLQIRRQSGTGSIEAHKGMVNRGATAASFVQPYRGSSYTQFPLSIPIVRWRGLPIEVTSMFEPFGQSPIFQEMNLGKSDFWEAVLTTIRLEALKGREVVAWAAGLGLGGLAAIIDPDHRAPGLDAIRNPMANGLVNGASQTGKSLLTDDWDANELILSAGDWFQIKDGQLFIATEEVVSNISGQATIPHWPAMKVSPANNGVIEINEPHLHSVLLGIPDIDTDSIRFAAPISIPFQEDY